MADLFLLLVQAIVYWDVDSIAFSIGKQAFIIKAIINTWW